MIWGLIMIKTSHRVVKVGVMPIDEFKRRTIAIAKGQIKMSKDEPKIWFRSMKSMSYVLSEQNQYLLKLIIEKQPQSVRELEPMTGRSANNILRILRLMESYGFVRLRKGIQGRGRAPLIPEVIYDRAEIVMRFY